MKSRHILPFAAALIMAGCVQTTKYNWGGYSQTLYDYHRDATTQADYQDALEKVIASEGPDRKVPPGIFAELGYLKLASGDADGAVALFEREKAAWPESTFMMDKAIASTHANKEEPPVAPGVSPAPLPMS